MPDIRDSPATSPVDPRDIFEFIRLNEDELDQRIWQDLLATEYSPFLLDLLRFILSVEPSIEGGLPIEKAEPTPPGRYRHWKEQLLRTPGRFVVPYIQFAAGGGANVRDFCARINFCLNRSKLLKLRKELKEEIAFAVGVTFEKMSDLESFKEIVAGASDLKSLVTDVLLAKAIPASLLFKMFYYGIEEICPCCKACEGKGKVGSQNCTACRGDGILEPFPYALL